MKFIVVLFLCLSSCVYKDEEPDEHIIWKKKRTDALFTDDGYLNIAGLFPIQNGIYTMGSDDTNDIKLPKDMPKKLAEITVKDSLIYFEYTNVITLNDTIKTKSYSYNYYNINNSFSLGSYVWFVHMDSGTKAIRLRNLNHPLLNSELQIGFFDYSEDYIIQGKYQKYTEPKTLNFKNILGDIYVDTIPGIIYFKYNGNHPFTTLVYPLANEFSSGLHVGFDLSGQIRFGPDITWVDEIDFSFDENLKDKFIKSIKEYWPQLDSTKLHPDYVGIRPKLQNFNETMKDFSIKDFNDHGVDGLINIQGVESPGVTSCLSIGKHVLNLIKS